MTKPNTFQTVKRVTSLFNEFILAGTIGAFFTTAEGANFLTETKNLPLIPLTVLDGAGTALDVIGLIMACVELAKPKAQKGDEELQSLVSPQPITPKNELIKQAITNGAAAAARTYVLVALMSMIVNQDAHHNNPAFSSMLSAITANNLYEFLNYFACHEERSTFEQIKKAVNLLLSIGKLITVIYGLFAESNDAFTAAASIVAVSAIWNLGLFIQERCQPQASPANQSQTPSYHFGSGINT